MKIIAFSFSPRKNGNTEIMLQEVLDSAKENGADETELIRFHDLKVAPCDGCASCQKTERCHINDDMQQVYDKLVEADGIVLGSPIYGWRATAQATIFMDRCSLFAATRNTRKLMRDKVGGICVVTGREGNAIGFMMLEHHITAAHMTFAGGATAFAGARGEVRKDARGIAECKALGKVIVRLIKRNERIDYDDPLEQHTDMIPRFPSLSKGMRR